MRIAIAGAHGKIALLLSRRLADHGDAVTGLVRNREHFDDIRRAGGEPVLCDLERATPPEIAEALNGADAVVFAAGAGPGSGAERKLTVDRDGAVKLLDAARAAGVPRYVIVSSVGAEDPPEGDEVFSVYLRAKAEADRAVSGSDRAWTIVRPGGLTDDPGTGRARIDTEPFRGRVSRADVAGALDLILRDGRAVGRTLYVNGGEDPIEQALDAALAG